MRDQKVPTDIKSSFLVIDTKESLINWHWNYVRYLWQRSQGELQYFIGVQLDGSDHVEPLRNRISENAEQKSAKLVYLLSSNFFLCEELGGSSLGFYLFLDHTIEIKYKEYRR